MITPFTIDTELITLNEYIKIERSSKYISAAKKKELTSKVAFLIKAQGIKLKDCLHDVDVFWYRNNKKHDADNVYFAIKFILDGLVKSGALATDGRKNIRNIHNYIEQSDTNYNYCIVKMKEVC